MLITLNLPDDLYEKSEALAAWRRVTVEQFTIEAVRNEIPDDPVPPNLPVIRSRRPGTLDLAAIDFDDLLA
jgi:hypothetical protein